MIIVGNIFYNTINVMDEIASCIKMEVLKDVMCIKNGV